MIRAKRWTVVCFPEHRPYEFDFHGINGRNLAVGDIRWFAYYRI
jgi:hypothetical protein